MENNAQARKEAVKSWLKNPYNLGILLILVVAFAVRLYYFIHTTNQAYWWDEAEYMATAKKWAFGIPYNINLQRPPLFQLFAALILTLGLSELVAKFILVLLPSLVLVYLTYVLGKELFDKKIGLIAAVASAFMWSFLFWSARFQPDFISVSLQMLALLFFWRMFKNPNNKNAIYAGVFSALAFYFKISALLIPLSALAFALFKDRLKFIKNKYYWTSFGAFIAALIPFMIWQYISFGSPVAFAPSYIGGTGIGQGWSYGWMTLSFYLSFTKTLFFILFLLGILYAIFLISIKYDLLLKDIKQREDGSIFSVIILVVVTLFYIFYIRGTIEDRWVFIIAPFIFYFSALGLVNVSNYAKKFNKTLSFLIIVAVLGLFAYSHIQHTSGLINNKLDSYIQVKEASLWIKENSNSEDLVLSNSYTQATTYAEREIIPYPALVRNLSDSYSYMPSKKEMLDDIVKERRPRFLMVSAFERHPDWTNEWIQENSYRLRPVQAYFNDAAKTQPNLIVYEIDYQAKPIDQTSLINQTKALNQTKITNQTMAKNQTSTKKTLNQSNSNSSTNNTKSS